METSQLFRLSLQITSIIHLTSGIALVILGIAAALTRAMWSFYAAPIWCGLLVSPTNRGRCVCLEEGGGVSRDVDTHAFAN